MPDPFDVFLSSPTVVDGEVYFGSGDGYVYALRIDTGELKWKFRTGDVVHATPAVADGLVYVGSWDSYFYAIDATSGRLAWRFRTGDDPDIHNQVGIQGSATIANGMVYFGCRDSHIYALDARTGRKRWDYSTDKSWVIGTPTVRGNTVFAATSDSGLLLSLDALTGKRLSALALGWPMFSSPVVEGKTLYIGSHKGILIAVDLPAMQVKWTFETDGLQKNRSRLIMADGRPNFGAAYRSNFYDDVVIGAAQMMELGAVLSSPVLADGYILFGSMDGNMYALK
jgi:outer membrane protein assembly factor BamB